MRSDPLVILLGHAAFAALMIASAIHKTVAPNYEILPRALAAPARALVPAIEVLLGAGALVLDAAPALSAIAALLAGYAGVIAFHLARGNRFIDCGCLSFTGRRKELRWEMVARNFVLAGIALFLSMQESIDRPLVWIDWIGLGFGLAVIALLYAVADLMIAEPAR